MENRYKWFQQNNPNNNKKEKKANYFKISFKITRIFLFISLFVLALTGCAQSFVIRADKKSGAGIEFYDGKNDVAPHVVSTKFEPDGFTYDAEENYWLSNSTDNAKGWGPEHSNDVATLDAIHKQVEANGGTWGGYYTSDKSRAWKGRTQSLRIEGDNANPIAKSTNGQYFVFSDTQTQIQDFGTILIPSTLKYAKKNISFVDAVRPTNNPTLDQMDEYFRASIFKYLLVRISQDTNLTETQVNNSIDNAVLLTGMKLDLQVSSNLVTISVNRDNGTLSIYNSGYVSRAITTWGDSWRIGPFYALFVWPLAKLANIMLAGIGTGLGGWETVLVIFIIVIIVKTIAYLISFKSTLQMVKQQELQGKVAQINAKYEPYKDNKQMQQRKRTETSELYKKENISPFGTIAASFISMPILISMWRVVSSVPHIKSSVINGIQFGATSWRELFAGHFQYLLLLFLSLLFQMSSALVPRYFSWIRSKRMNVHQKAAMKKQNKTQNIMLIVVALFAVITNAGLQIYLIFSAMYTMGQNILNHYIIKHMSKNKKKSFIQTPNIL
ncbi:MAG: YidC/Oxa1 family membrane protein insertase [Mycoplasma sp.]|nr:YidC/Oxa1 family membrane protein insertase [Mycoplasma sp.]